MRVGGALPFSKNFWVRTRPREKRDLFIPASNSWVQCFDNISGLPGWLSDELCKLSTGGGLSTRELYTDDEEIILDVRRPIILNGITDFVTHQDLIDRSILVEYSPIEEDQRGLVKVALHFCGYGTAHRLSE
jgi:hypothetical protein